MSEAELLEQVRELAKLYGWDCYHTLRSEGSEAGWPDLVLSKLNRGVIFAELKSERGRLTRDQERWLAQLAEAGDETHVWRPCHLNAVAWRLGPRGHRYDDVADAATIAEVARG